MCGTKVSCLIQYPIKASKRFAIFAPSRDLKFSSKPKNVNNAFTAKPFVSLEPFPPLSDRDRAPLLLFFKFTQIYVKNRPLAQLDVQLSPQSKRFPAKRRFYRLKSKLFPHAPSFSEKFLPFVLVKRFYLLTTFAVFRANNPSIAVYNRHNYNPLVTLNDEGEVVAIIWLNWSLFIGEWLSFFYYLRICSFLPVTRAFCSLVIPQLWGQSREWLTPRHTRDQTPLRLETRAALVNSQTNFRALSSKNYFIFNTSLL